MRKLASILIITLIIGINCGYSKTTKVGFIKIFELRAFTIKDTIIFEVVDDYPQYKGGFLDMYKFISKNVIYPVDALRRSKGGKVVIRFVIDLDGNVTKPAVYKSAGWGMDEEAMRIISIMPPWIPAKINGQNVACYFKVPIHFRAK